MEQAFAFISPHFVSISQAFLLFIIALFNHFLLAGCLVKRYARLTVIVVGNIAAFKSATKCNMEEWHGPALCTTLQHWTLWNSFVEQTAAFRFRLEDVDSPAKHGILTKIAKLGKLDETPHFNASLFDRLIDNVTVSAQRNSGHTRKGKRRLTWDKLAKVCSSRRTAMAQIQAIRYGYAVAPENLVPDVWDECDSTRKTLKVQRCFFKANSMKWTCRLFSDKCQA